MSDDQPGRTSFECFGHLPMGTRRDQGFWPSTNDTHYSAADDVLDLWYKIS